MNWAAKQIVELSTGGLPVARRKFRVAIGLLGPVALLVVNAPWAVPVVLLIRLIRPWVHIRMGTILASRIGHFIADTSILLAEKSLVPNTTRQFDWLWLPGKTSNAQWEKMVRRQMFVRWWVRYLDGVNRVIPGGTRHALPRPTENHSRSIYSPLRRAEARFRFTTDEDKEARAWLSRRGWKSGDPFVCLLVRDAAYLSTDALHSSDRVGSWSYHDYRDSDIDTYLDAIRALVDRGYWVIRMGKVMRKPLSFQHPKVIDYPFVSDPADLMDIWLSIHCRFFISTGTGLDVLPGIYGIPAVFVNGLPLIVPGAAWHENIWVPKHLRWQQNGRFLTLRDHCEHPYSISEEYRQAGIVIEDLTSAEILAAILECEERVAGTWKEVAEHDALQRRYWEKVQSWPDFYKLNDYIHPQARVGHAWLKSMGDAFFE